MNIGVGINFKPSIKPWKKKIINIDVKIFWSMKAPMKVSLEISKVFTCFLCAWTSYHFYGHADPKLISFEANLKLAKQTFTI